LSWEALVAKPLRAQRATPVRTIRLAIVERHALVLVVMRQMIDDQPDIEVIAEVVDVEDAIRVLPDDPPDVILIDADASISKVMLEIQHLKREVPSSPIVLIGHLRDDDELFAAIQAGAAAFVFDDTRPAELVASIRAVADGRYIIDDSVAARPAVAHHVLEAFRNASLFGEIALDDVTGETFSPLSARETEILEAIASGLTNRGVADALSISEQTVKNHVTSILRKLAANDRTQAVLQALNNQWLSFPQEPPRRRN
jgi:DNA-binding NarL/FixJ family response regulator